MISEPCLDRDSTCNPKADRCCPGLICLAESGSTDFICGTNQESFRKRDEGIYVGPLLLRMIQNNKNAH